MRPTTGLCNFRNTRKAIFYPSKPIPMEGFLHCQIHVPRTAFQFLLFQFIFKLVLQFQFVIQKLLQYH